MSATSDLSIKETLAYKRFEEAAKVSVEDDPDKASRADAEAGTDNEKLMTPLRTLEAINARGSFASKTASFTAEAGKSYSVDTTAGEVTATLPASPAEGDVIQFADATANWATNNFLVNPNGGKVFGNTGNFRTRTPAVLMVFVFVGGDRGWAMFTGQTVPLLVSAPVITNDPYGTLTSSTGIWSSAPYEWAYQWQISDDGNTGWADINGETANTHTVLLTEAGKYIRVKIVATNGVGDSDPAYSTSAAYNVPSNTAVPTISGTAEVGETLTATSGTWSNSPASYAYQWQVSDNGTSGWADISGATSATYTLLAAQEGKFVRAEVVATNGVGDSEAAYSAASAEIAPASIVPSLLLTFWKLADLTDASGNGHTLTNNNSVTFGAGKIGDAATVGEGVYLDRSMAFNTATSDWSASGWFKETSHPSHNAAFLAGQNAGGVFWFWLDGTKVYMTAGTYSTALGGNYNLNEWTHVCAVIESGIYTLYVNGVSQGTLAWDGSSDASQIRIGLDIGDQDFIGQVDAVGLWHRALTAQEVAQLYNAGSGVEPA